MSSSSLGTSLKIAFRNLGRNRRRTYLALVALGLAQFFVVAVDGFMAGYEDALRDVMTGPLLGHAQIHAKDYRDERSMEKTISDLEAKLSVLAQEKNIEATFPRVFAPSLAAKTEEGFTSLVLGVDPTGEQRPGGLLAPDNSKLLEGSLDFKSGKPAQIQEGGTATEGSSENPRSALIGAALAKRQDLKIGDELALIGQTADGSMAADLVKVSGIVRSDVEMLNGNGILIPLGAAQEIFGLENQAHEITLRGVDSMKSEQLASSVAALPGFQDLEVLPWQKLSPQLVQMLGMMGISTLIILIFLFTAAAAGVANTMVMSTFERTREMGVLLALGAGPGRIVLILVVETLFLGVLGLALGTALGASLTAYLGQEGFSMAALAGGSDGATELSVQGVNFGFQVFPRLRLTVIEQTTIAMGITCLLSALWPAWFVSRLQPTEAMRK
jgi:ABC-type lipoprotein release transport system permease subunit